MSGEVLRFRWAASPGLRLVTTPTTFQVVDAGGGTVFTAPGLAMWDSADVPVGRRESAQVVTAGGDSRRTPVPVEVLGDSFLLRPDEAFFEAPVTVFPVVVGPSLTTTTDTMWAMALIGKTQGWQVENLGKGSLRGEGWMMREHNERGARPESKSVGILGAVVMVPRLTGVWLGRMGTLAEL